jgi:hypothetical protein
MASVDPAYGDQDVCHIIARGNGGADTRDNYLILNHSFNMRIGVKGDHIMVYLAGLQKGSAAVQASVAKRGYSGDDAYTLYKRGETFFRDHFGAQLRDHSPQDRVSEATMLEAKSSFKK